MKTLISIAVFACAMGAGSAAFAYGSEFYPQFDRCVAAAGLNSSQSVRISDRHYWLESNAERNTRTVRFNAAVRGSDGVVPNRVMCEMKRTGRVLAVTMQPGIYVQKK